MTIRAGRFFRAGTQGQGFFKAETGSDARINRSYADLFKSQPGAAPDPDTYGLGLHSGGGEDIFDENPEPSYRFSQLMPLNQITAEVDRRAGEGVIAGGTVSRWVGRGTAGNRPDPQTRHGGGPAKSPFPTPVTPAEWAGGGLRPNLNQLWRRSEVEQWLDTEQVRPDMPGLHRKPWDKRPGGKQSEGDKRPDIPPITTRTVSNLLSNMDKRFQGEGGSLPTEGSKDEHGNWRDDK